MTIANRFTSLDDLEQRLGAQVRGLRLRRDWNQNQLAIAAGVSLSAVKNLEQAKGSSLKTLSKIAVALDRADWLLSLAPTSSISPIDALRNSRVSPRSRVYRGRHERD